MGLTKQNIMEKPDYTIEFSFDDGYKKDMKIAELLEKYGLRGTFYIIVDKPEHEGFLDWNDIKDLDVRGHEIGSHTVSHPSDLKLLYDPELHYEIQNSKDLIENVLGHNISKFCYPRGRYDDRVKGMVQRAGYVHARVTGKPGITSRNDPLAMPGTVQMFPRNEYAGVPVLDYAKAQIDKVKKEGGYCNIWAHAKDLDSYYLWDTLEEVIKYAVRP